MWCKLNNITNKESIGIMLLKHCVGNINNLPYSDYYRICISEILYNGCNPDSNICRIDNCPLTLLNNIRRYYI